MANLSEKIQVVFNEKYGRHLAAAIDLEIGDVILEEAPLFITPQWDAPSMKCASCFQDSFIMCNACCVFPLCLDCTSHNKFDCEFFCTTAAELNKNILVKNYASFAILKLLLLLENPESATEAKVMLDEQKALPKDYPDSENWQEHNMNVVEPLLNLGIANFFKNVQIDAELLHRMCYDIDANAFEVSGKDGDSLKGIYEWGAKLPHQCVPNTVISVNNEFKMKIYAAMPIRSGEVIYNSYTNPLMGTSQRQHHLRISRGFSCNCFRCLDATELGTHMSSIKCLSCAEGYAICNSQGNWICMHCEAPTNNQSVRELLAEVGEEMVKAQDDLESYEKILAHYAANFHPNHFLIVDMKQNIAMILKSLAHKKKLLERRVQLNAELLPVMRAVIPGLSKLYAIALYEYMMPFVELTQMEFCDKTITKPVYLQKLLLAQAVAQDALDLLKFEPLNSPEGQLIKRIKMQLQSIEVNMQKHKLKANE